MKVRYIVLGVVIYIIVTFMLITLVNFLKGEELQLGEGKSEQQQLPVNQEGKNEEREESEVEKQEESLESTSGESLDENDLEEESSNPGQAFQEVIEESLSPEEQVPPETGKSLFEQIVEQRQSS